MTIRYTDRRYGQRPPAGPRFPQHALPIRTAPETGSTVIYVYDQTGKRAPALFHRGEWRTVGPLRDHVTGQTRYMMNGGVITQPICWSSS